MEQSLRSRVNMTVPTLSPTLESGLQRIRRKLDSEENKPITLAQAMRPNPEEGANRLRAFLGQGLGLRGGDEIEAISWVLCPRSLIVFIHKKSSSSSTISNKKSDCIRKINECYIQS